MAARWLDRKMNKVIAVHSLSSIIFDRDAMKGGPGHECDNDVYVGSATSRQTELVCKSDMRRSICSSDWESVHIKTVQTKKVGRVNKQIGNSNLNQVQFLEKGERIGGEIPAELYAICEARSALRGVDRDQKLGK